MNHRGIGVEVGAFAVTGNTLSHVFVHDPYPVGTDGLHPPFQSHVYITVPMVF